MTDFESSIVTSADGLRALYAQPSERVAKKPIDHVNEVGRAFIAASPFLVLATGSRQGLDCSPKGDQPGFVQVAEDGRTLFIPTVAVTIGSMASRTLLRTRVSR